MCVEASYRRLKADEWDQLQQLAETYQTLPPEDRYEAYARIADSDELRSSDRYLDIDKDWHALHAMLTCEISNPSNIRPVPPPLGNVVIGGTETPLGDLVECYLANNTIEAKFVADQLMEQCIPAIADMIDVKLVMGGFQPVLWGYGPKVRVRQDDLS